MVYEALISLCRKTGSWAGSYPFLANYSLCGSDDTASRRVKELHERGLILINDEDGTISIPQNEVPTPQNEALTPQNASISKEKRTKKENIINNKRMDVSREETSSSIHPLFEKFWSSFISVSNQNWKREYHHAKKYFESEKMSEDWRRLAVERAAEHAADRNPTFYLQDEDFLRVGTSAATKIEPTPHWLTNEEQYTLMQAGAVLAFCQKPDGKGFGTVTQADAERFKLNKVRNVKLS